MLSEENTAKLYHKQGEKKYNSFGEKIKNIKEIPFYIKICFVET